MNAKVDGTPLTNQPAGYRFDALEAYVDIAADGTPIATKRSVAGTPIEWEWGQVVPPATVTELETKRGDQVTHTITFTTAAGLTRSFLVHWLANPAFELARGKTYERLPVRFIVIEELEVS